MIRVPLLLVLAVLLTLATYGYALPATVQSDSKQVIIGGWLPEFFETSALTRASTNATWDDIIKDVTSDDAYMIMQSVGDDMPNELLLFLLEVLWRFEYQNGDLPEGGWGVNDRGRDLFNYFVEIMNNPYSYSQSYFCDLTLLAAIRCNIAALPRGFESAITEIGDLVIARRVFCMSDRLLLYLMVSDPNLARYVGLYVYNYYRSTDAESHLSGNYGAAIYALAASVDKSVAESIELSVWIKNATTVLS